MRRLTLTQAWESGARSVRRNEGALRGGLLAGLTAWQRTLARLVAPGLRVEDLPWAVLEGPVLRGWESTARGEIRAAAAVRKDARDPVPYGGLALTDAERRALLWLETQGLVFVRDLRGAEIRRIRSILQRAQTEGWDVPRMRRAIVDSVGLDPRRQTALERYREKLEVDGLRGEKLERRVQQRADAMRRQRAETIARTETVRARNQGHLSEWTQMQAEGDLPSQARKRWVAAYKIACPVCQELHQHPPIPLRTPFPSGLGAVMAPPAHPNCRCALVVV